MTTTTTTTTVSDDVLSSSLSSSSSLPRVRRIRPHVQYHRQRQRRQQQERRRLAWVYYVASSSSVQLILQLLLLLLPHPHYDVIQLFRSSSSSTTTTVPVVPVVVSALSLPISIDPILHFGAGAVAGGVGAIAAYPFDYVKSQLQTEYGKQRWGSKSTSSSAGPGRRSSVDGHDDVNDSSDSIGGGGGGGGGLQCAWDTLVEYGPQRFYKGVTVQVIGIAPEKGIKLGVNDVLKQMFVSTNMGGGHFPLWAQIISGGIAGACQVLASSPLEVMKVGLQTSNRTIAEVWTDIGGSPKGLFRGATACIVRDVLFTAVCFPLYAYWVEDCNVPTFVAGALSGVIASFIATPPDVIKTRILSQDDRKIHTVETNMVDKSKEAFINGRIDSSNIEETTTTLDATDIVVMNSESVGSIAVSPAAVLDLKTAASSSSSTNSSQPWTDIYANQQFVANNNDPDETSSLPPLSSASHKSSARSAATMELSDSSNPWSVLINILEVEGPSVLFSGVTERCVGAIPRFGTTLAMHDYLEHIMEKAGWFSQTTLT